MLRKIDAFLNGITMYRLLVYGLGLIALIVVVLSFMGTMDVPVLHMLASLAVIISTCYVTNRGMSWAWKVPTNSESWLISSLILFFVMPPVDSWSRAAALAAVGIVAMGSKFLVASQGRHIVNPSVFGMVFVSSIGLLQSTWWVGSALLWPFVLILGLLIVRKTRRFHLLISFTIVSLSCVVISALMNDQDVAGMLQLSITSAPLIFLGTIMLTEPSTMPNQYRHRIIFGGLVGALYALHPQVGGFYMYPEVALLVGNLYAFVVNPHYRLRLRLKEVRQISAHVYDLAFESDKKPEFAPGQYMEWTLGHHHVDDRGNRRTFTIASSPTEDLVHMGIKTYEPSSTYKKALLAMKPGDTLFAGQLSGGFVMPADTSQKLVFVAGGIGITPFRSMAQYLIDTNTSRDIILIYAVGDPAELAYQEVFERAASHGLKLVPLLTIDRPAEGWKGLHGMANQELFTQQVPDMQERMFYLSGPHAMVDGIRRQLRKAGVSGSQIRVDYFPGY